MRRCPVCLEHIDRNHMCNACAASYCRAQCPENTTIKVIAWAAKRARILEHKRMADKVKELELKLRIEIATTNAIIRKYGNTTTEIGDMNNAK